MTSAGPRFPLRLRLVALVGVFLLGIQIVNLVTVSASNHALVFEGAQRLLASEASFLRNAIVSENQRLAKEASIVVSDLGLRQAIARRDRITARGHLELIRAGLGVDQVSLLDGDGFIEADTVPDPGLLGTAYPFLEFLEKAHGSREPTTTFAILGRTPVRLIVVPILAPVPVGFLVLRVDLDLESLKSFSGLSENEVFLSAITQDADQEWRSLLSQAPTDKVEAGMDGLGGNPRWNATWTVDGEFGEHALYAVRLETAQSSPALGILFSAPLADALATVNELRNKLIAILGVTFLASVFVVHLVARRVVRPLRALALAARRVSGGDYSPNVVVESRDEVEEVALCFNQMVSDIKDREAKIAYQARFDQLTGRPNRMEFLDAARQRFRIVGPGAAIAVIVVNLDTIRTVRRTLGNRAADDCLLAVTERLMEGVDSTCSWVCGGRLSSEDFGLLVEGRNDGQIDRSIDTLLDLLGSPVPLDDALIDIAPHIGLAMFPRDGTDPERLLQMADVAVDIAKQNASHLHRYVPGRDDPDTDQLSLMGELKYAIANNELVLCFQPQFCTKERRLCGAEALVRWNHPTRGTIPPDRFIPVAENTGQIRLVTEWVVRESLRLAKTRLHGDEEFDLSVNVSAKDIADPDFPGKIRGWLEEASVAPSRLRLEVTESAFLHNPEEACLVLEELSAIGVTLSIDDFGAGYSSLSYLKSLPVHDLKIDKGFILDLASSPEDQAIVGAAVDLGNRLGLEVTGEGVEDRESVALLTALGCARLQGFYFSRPVPFEELEKMREAAYPS